MDTGAGSDKLPTPHADGSTKAIDYDVIVIGAGIVGLATSKALRDAVPTLRIAVIEKEASVGAHQSSHNSGVLHSGVYYRSDSDKARLCVTGKAELEQWCNTNDVPFDTCGKVIVATTVDEVDRLHSLHERCVANGTDGHLIGPVRLTELEPHATGLAALHVPATGVISFESVADHLADHLRDTGTTIALNTEVTGIDESHDSVTVSTTGGTFRGRHLVNCAGLHSDRIGALAGLTPTVRIVPFRGEYHELVPERRHLVRHLIYPVPDPRFPFLGVHFTRGLDGRVHIGPNAVLALSREGYRRRDITMRDLRTLSRDPAVWHLARRYASTGATEALHAVSRRSFIKALQRLVPEIRSADVIRSGSGVRAQAVRDDGTLEDDFAFMITSRSVHVLNAPSPAATASFAIGRRIADTLLGN